MKTPVLIVDDDETTRQFEAVLLQTNGYQCSLAGNAESARELLQQQEFPLALLDVQMPGMSGVTLAKTIRIDHPQTTVIMVTGVNDLEVARTAVENGAYGYVIKPFKSNELVANVQAALRWRDHERRLQEDKETLQRQVLDRIGNVVLHAS